MNKRIQEIGGFILLLALLGGYIYALSPTHRYDARAENEYLGKTMVVMVELEAPVKVPAQFTFIVQRVEVSAMRSLILPVDVDLYGTLVINPEQEYKYDGVGLGSLALDFIDEENRINTFFVKKIEPVDAIPDWMTRGPNLHVTNIEPLN